MGFKRFLFKGGFLLFLLGFFASCAPQQERAVSARILVKEGYNLPVEVLKANIETVEGYKKLVLLIRNVSDGELNLVCKVYFVDDNGFVINIPGFGFDVCKIPPKGTYREVVPLPVNYEGWQRLVVELKRIKVGNISPSLP